MSAVSIKEGDDVLAVIARSAPASAWVNGVGAIEDVEIAVEGAAEPVTETVAERVTLLSLSGPAAGPIMVAFARAAGDGVVVSGGRLVRARSGGVAIIVVPSGLVVAERHPHSSGATGGPRGASGERGAENPWASLLKRSAEDEDETAEMPRAGDRVDHFVFGLCEVMVVSGDRMKIRDVSPPQRLREIHVGAVKMLAPTEHDGHRVFKLVKRT